MNREQIEQFAGKFREGLKTKSLTSDNRVVAKATYDFDLGEGIDVTVDEIARVYFNDDLVGSISFGGTPGEPTKKTIEVDVTDKVIPGNYNVFKFETIILKNFFGQEISSDAEFSAKIRGSKLVNEHYRTKLEVRTISDTWAVSL